MQSPPTFSDDQHHVSEKHSTKLNQIEHLFNPDNVVLVGASDRSGHWSKRVWDNLKRFGYPQGVYLVNPNRDRIWGIPCYPTLKELPEKPDHLAIFTPASTTIDVLRTGAEFGARTATVYASGFQQSAEPKTSDLRDVILQCGLTVVGPNCMGVAGGASNFSTIPDETLPPISEGAVAVVAQSGSMCTSINRALNEQQMSAAYLVSCGNQVDTNFGHFIRYFSLQNHLRVILCYIESIPDPELFLEAALDARRKGKVVVAVKIGGSEAARQAALAHTGALAGNSKVFEAYAASAGVIVMPSLEDAIEATEFLSRNPVPQHPGLAIITISGALRSLITEAASQLELPLARLSSETRGALRAVLRQDDIENPLDTKLTLPTKDYLACIEAAMEDPEVGLVLLAEEFPKDESIRRRVDNWTALEALAPKANDLGKALAVFTPLLGGMSEFDRTLRSRIPHVPVMRETVKTLRVIKRITTSCLGTTRSGPFYAPPMESDIVASIRERAAGLTAPTPLNEIESKWLLAEYGIPVCPEHFVTSLDEALAAAESLGFPVVLKAVSSTATHKSDLGLVALNLTNNQQLSGAFARVNKNGVAANLAPEGFLVAKQISKGIETVLGAHIDREMGPCVMFGLGGTLVELFEDVAFAPALLDLKEAAAMVRTTRVSKMISGLRGAPPADIDTLIETIVKLGKLVSDLSDVLEAVDINPFLVSESGGLALDGLVVLRPTSSASFA